MELAEFEDLYARAAPRLVGIVYTLTGDLHEAEDCVQEAFVKAWSRHRSLDRDGNPEAWLRVAAMRIAVSRWRRLRSRDRAFARVGEPAHSPGPDGTRTDVVQAMRRLKPRARMVVALHYLCDMSVEDVARATGMSTGTVKSHLSRGRDLLHTVLSDTESDPRAGSREAGHA